MEVREQVQLWRWRCWLLAVSTLIKPMRIRRRRYRRPLRAQLQGSLSFRAPARQFKTCWDVDIHKPISKTFFRSTTQRHCRVLTVSGRRSRVISEGARMAYVELGQDATQLASIGYVVEYTDAQGRRRRKRRPTLSGALSCQRSLGYGAESEVKMVVRKRTLHEAKRDNS